MNSCITGMNLHVTFEFIDNFKKDYTFWKSNTELKDKLLK